MGTVEFKAVQYSQCTRIGQTCIWSAHSQCPLISGKLKQSFTQHYDATTLQMHTSKRAYPKLRHIRSVWGRGSKGHQASASSFALHKSTNQSPFCQLSSSSARGHLARGITAGAILVASPSSTPLGDIAHRSAVYTFHLYLAKKLNGLPFLCLWWCENLIYFWLGWDCNSWR